MGVVWRSMALKGAVWRSMALKGAVGRCRIDGDE